MKTKIDFVGIGPPKCGTTSLFEALNQNEKILFPCKKLSGVVWPHPYTPRFKEVEFFLRLWENITDHDRFVEMYNQTGDEVLGDVTPMYIMTNGSLDRIKSYNPDIKILFTVRNPLTRIYSELCFKRSWNEIPDDIYNDHYQKPITIDGPTSAIDGIAVKDPFKTFYLYNSYYADQYKRLLERFPKENISIIRLEDFSTNQQEVMNYVFDFLGVPRITLHKNYNSNPEIYSPNYGEYKLWIDIQDDLKTVLRPEMQEFYDMTGIDFREDVN